MIAVINGTGKPQIVVTYTDNSTATINLPYCKALTEACIVLDKLQEMIDYTEEPDEIGYKYGAILDYSTWLRGDRYLLLQPLLQTGKREVWLTPRIDMPARKFKVWLVNKGEVSVKARAGHAGVRLQFRGLDVLGAYPLVGTITEEEAVADDERIINAADRTIYGW